MTALAKYRPLPAAVNGKERLQALTKATTPELRKELAEALSLTAGHLNYLGAVWAELTRRGEDLSELKTGMGFYLAKIAAGELLAETVVKYAGEPGVLRRLGAVSLDQQRTALSTGKLPWGETAKTGRPRQPSSNGVSSAPPPAGPVLDLKTPLDEALYELVRLKHAYGHVAELKTVFEAFDKIQSGRELFKDSDRRLRK